MSISTCINEQCKKQTCHQADNQAWPQKSESSKTVQANEQPERSREQIPQREQLQSFTGFGPDDQIFTSYEFTFACLDCRIVTDSHMEKYYVVCGVEKDICFNL